ncbi:hypothetical protein H0H81_009836 [Sphagnurus paluster]|uniref:RNA-dependent RNA polymerase n=1 Tax=Sphagnurus paluster TaxID=117069 RepID=A0A9P7KJV6_9AGAR|nr:hypothetical protein H0H81_009836 [Sphagnurus paluster]
MLLCSDQFSVIFYEPLLPSDTDEPASYESAGTFEIDGDSTVEDICNFVVEYIKSDVLGLLSDRLLVIADQSKDGIRDENCLWLAQLCSQAVDYPKQGIPVDIENDRLPRTLIRCKPDWHAAEVVSPRRTDYYDSDRALGELYRSITLDDPEPISVKNNAKIQPLQDPISMRLKSRIEHYLGRNFQFPEVPRRCDMFIRYVDELRYICATHTISNTPGVRLLEAEVVTGTILAKCSQKRYRKDRTYRMRLHASTLFRNIEREVIEDVSTASQEQLIVGLGTAWEAWIYSQNLNYEFGACSFGLIALGIIFDCLDRLTGVDTINETQDFSSESDWD